MLISSFLGQDFSQKGLQGSRGQSPSSPSADGEIPLRSELRKR
nr:MAG TPA: hypothetical protein [Caudoviricetes sp.]